MSCTREKPRVVREMFSKLDVRRKSIVTLALSGQLATADTYLLVSRINAFFRRLQRLGCLQCHVTVAELMNKSVL